MAASLRLGVVCDEALYRCIVPGLLDGSAPLTGFRVEKEDSFACYKVLVLKAIASDGVVVLVEAKHGKVSGAVVASNLVAAHKVNFLLTLTRFARLSNNLDTTAVVLSKGVIQHDVDVRPWYEECAAQSVKKVVMPVSQAFVEGLTTALRDTLPGEVIVGLTASGDTYLTQEAARNPANPTTAHIKTVSDATDFCDTVSAGPVQLAFEANVKTAVVGLSIASATAPGTQTLVLSLLEAAVGVLSKDLAQLLLSE